MGIDVAQIHHVGIYPPIGIARVGNSKAENGWFPGPEIPGRIDTPLNGFKDDDGAIKRQAARFRVYGFREDGSVVAELNQDNGFTLDWTLEIGNQKAAWYIFQSKNDSQAWKQGSTTLRNPTIQADLPPEERSQLYIRSGEKTISGYKQGPVELSGKFTGSSKKTYDVYLGEAHTDESGRLWVLAGRGASRSVLKDDDPYPLILNDFDSPDWIDDTSDGWVTVSVSHSDLADSLKPAHKARVIGTTPKFSTEIFAPTSLYDVMEDIYEAEARFKPGYLENLKVDWYQHIWPLLQRPPRLSWVNGQANGGHGLFGPGNFFDPKWVAQLSDPSSANDAIRKTVYGRMRLPTDTELTQARAGQSFKYFMPWLSGDGGRVTEGAQETWASVTRLQYDRLNKWANGQFSVGNPPCVYDFFSEIPLDDQPGALIKASLEATIGAPLYPGIEMSWNAEIPENYELDSPFTLADKLLPGDLTKYLSLPWQSDFYMCRSYWWPSARPDAIVTDDDYQEWLPAYIRWEVKYALWKDKNDPTEVEPAPPNIKRLPWERGLRVNYTDEYEDQPLFANTDMVQLWHQLGFVVKADPPLLAENGLPIYVEKERGVIHKVSTVVAPAARQVRNRAQLLSQFPHLPKPNPNKPIDTIDSLRTHLQSAMAVELSTIPLYLFGMYTVATPEQYANDPRYYDPIMAAVRGVLAEEMLHLSLAGNILKAVGGNPKVYHPDVFPEYPGFMLHRAPPLELKLREMTKKNLDTFIAVEKPADEDAPAQPDEYNTLGQFYKAIKEGIANLSSQGDNIFDAGTSGYQFAPGLGYYPRVRDAGGSVVVVDQDSAFAAIKTIVDQGEGNPGPYDDIDRLEKDHYAIFEELQSPDTPDWKTLPVFPDPKTDKYFDLDIRLYQVSKTFDAAYCFLLMTIERLWEIDNSDSRKQLVLGNMYTLMMGVLTPLAKFLVSQPIGTDGKVAAPCFDWYDFGGKPALKQVLHEMQTALDAYLDVTEETQDQVAVHDFGKQLEVLLPIQNTMSALLDLHTFEKLATPVLKQSLPGVNNRGAKGFGPMVL